VAWKLQGEKNIRRSDKQGNEPKYLNTKWRYKGEKNPHHLKSFEGTRADSEKTVGGLDESIQLLRNECNTLHKTKVDLEADLRRPKNEVRKEEIQTALDRVIKTRDGLEKEIALKEKALEKLKEKNDKKEADKKAADNKAEKSGKSKAKDTENDETTEDETKKSPVTEEKGDKSSKGGAPAFLK